MQQNNLKDKTMKQSDLQRVCKYNMYPKNSKLYSDNRFLIIDNGIMGGSHWTCSIIKGNKSFYFDSFGAQPDKFLVNQLFKPILFHNYLIEDINFNLCGCYCLYFFYLIERINIYDAILNMLFGLKNMLTIALGNSSNFFENKIDTSLFVQK